MPRTRSLAWSELKIGVVAVAALTITALTIFTLTGSRGFFWQRYHLKTRFDNVAGLNVGAPVRVAGFEVGQVTALAFAVDAGEKVDVIFEVNKDQQSRITTASVARLGSISLLGQGAVDISPATSGAPIPDWGYVPAGRTAAALSDVTDQAAQGIQELTKLIQDMRMGKGTVGKLIYSNETHDKLTAALESVESGVNELKTTLGRANRIGLDIGMKADYYAGLKQPIRRHVNRQRETQQYRQQ